MPGPHLLSSFSPSSKRIDNAEALQRFLKGNTVKDFMGFILSLNQAVIGELGDKLGLCKGYKGLR